MPTGLSLLLALTAQAAPAAAAASPEAAADEAPTEKTETPASAEPCRPAQANADTIVICAERPQGYRIDPDILTMKKLKKIQRSVRPVKPGLDGTKDRTVCAVGPQGCQIEGVNLLAAAGTAVEMAKRLAEGKEIGSMFITDPQLDDYQLYVIAKRVREAKELEAKAKAIAKAK